MKTKLYVPNYKQGTILNLVASIENALGGKSEYQTLKEINSRELGKSKNVVLIILDGLGYEFLMRHGKGSFFNENIKAKLTSVFPAATSAAIPTLLTGYPAEKHGMLGWYLFIKEIGTVIIPLMFVSRVSKEPLNEKVDFKSIFDIKPLANRIKRKSYLINPRRFSKLKFTKVVAGKAKLVWYNEKKVSDFFSKIKNTIKLGKRKKYIYAYYPNPDALIHDHGTTHKKVINNFKKVNKEIKKFVKAIEGTDTTLIITADHGLYDIKKGNSIEVRKHPKLDECLSIPLCGEGRLAYAYVKAGKEKHFEDYCKTKMKKYLDLYKTRDFIRKFKLFEMSERFLNRLGDYVLVLKEPYRIGDYLISSEPSKHIACHGGFSKEEIFVPLIIVEAR